MYKGALFLVILLALEAVLVWRPFNSELVAYQTDSADRKVAGQVVKGFHLVQEVPAKLLKVPTPKKQITHWWKGHKKLYTHRPNCFSIRFASYNRRNADRLAVAYKQGTQGQTWTLDAADLGNEFRQFCPSAGLDAELPLQIAISGIDGRKGSSVTAWLSKAELEPATLNGRPVEDRSLFFRLTYFHHVGPKEILGIDKGAFIAACSCSTGVAVLALAFTFNNRRRKRRG